MSSNILGKNTNNPNQTDDRPTSSNVFARTSQGSARTDGQPGHQNETLHGPGGGGGNYGLGLGGPDPRLAKGYREEVYDPATPTPYTNKGSGLGQPKSESGDGDESGKQTSLGDKVLNTVLGRRD